MTGAELKTLRESMGLSVGWLAEAIPNKRLGGQGVSRRIVELWEADSVPVPDDVASLILGVRRAWLAWVSSAAEAAAAQIDSATSELGEPADVVLHRYRTDALLSAAHPEMAGMPAAHHAAGLARIKELIERTHDVPVVIEYRR